MPVTLLHKLIQIAVGSVTSAGKRKGSKNRFREEKLIEILREQAAEQSTADVCCWHSVTSATFKHRWLGPAT